MNPMTNSPLGMALLVLVWPASPTSNGTAPRCASDAVHLVPAESLHLLGIVILPSDVSPTAVQLRLWQRDRPSRPG
jgi:hypothetical protein